MLLSDIPRVWHDTRFFEAGGWQAEQAKPAEQEENTWKVRHATFSTQKRADKVCSRTELFCCCRELHHLWKTSATDMRFKTRRVSSLAPGDVKQVSHQT